jgi:thiamine-phosphate pyrophosphorylase
MSSALPVPAICLVTDRRRLPANQEDALVQLVEAASAAGVTLVQVREQEIDDRRLLALVSRVVSAAKPGGASVVVNDRVDIALAAGAAGVHLRGDSPPAAAVRPIVPPGFLIGRSVHSVGEAVEAEAAGVDYLIAGTIFPTGSKGPGAPIAGIEVLADVCAAVRVPVLAIGGISTDKVGDIAAAGAAGAAAIDLFARLVADSHREPLDNAFRRIVGEIRHAFER